MVQDKRKRASSVANGEPSLPSCIRDWRPQVKALCTLPSGGVPATYLSSAQSKDDTNAVYSELRKAVPSCKLLYVTPEQLCKNGMLQELLAGLHSRGKLARLVIDEVRHSSGFTLSGFMGLPTAKP